jgi:two-component system sensor histidine kinase BaeS
VTAIVISGWAIYNTACFLAAGVGNLDIQRQEQFNSTLQYYLWLFMIIAVIVGSMLQFYLTKQLVKPIHELIESTKQLKRGHFPAPVKVHKRDEIGQLVTHYNGLIEQLQTNEQQRKKLISDLSHEIRTPLANLNGYLYALKGGDIQGDEALFTALHKESERLSQMVEQLDQVKEWDHLSTQFIIKKDPTEITTLLNQCVSMFEWTLKQKHISIQVNAETCCLPIHVESIQQVISNLLDNAIRYYVGTDAIVLTGKNQSDGYYMSVSGPAKPIPDNEKDQVFKRFYRLDASRSRDTGGSGLGLAITKEIVERHQGKIGVDTTTDHNTFWVVLPYHLEN